MRTFNKKILFAAMLCVAFMAGKANAEIITDEENRNVVIKNSIYQNITNEQNILNYGSKWGSESSRHNSSGWIVDIENTDFINNTQSTNDSGFIIKNCSSSFVLSNVKMQGNTSKGNSPIIDVWKGAADEVADGGAPNYNAVITFINSEVTGNNNYIFLQKNAIANVIAQNSETTLFSDNGKNGTFKVISGTNGAAVNFNADSSSVITVNDSIVDTDGRTSININKSGLTYTGLQQDGSGYVAHDYDITETGGTYNFNDTIGVGTLNIYNGAKVKFGSYEHQNGGNPVTTYGSLNVRNFTNDGYGGTLDFINNHADANNFGNLSLNSNLHADLDFLISDDGTVISGDTFSANVSSTSNGNLIIDSFNITPGKTFNDIVGNVNLLILNNSGSSNNFQIVLSDYAQTQMENTVRLMSSGSYVGPIQDDTLKSETEFSDEYWSYHLEGTADVWGKIGLTSTNSTNDSIGLIVDHYENENLEKINYEKLGDTLALVVNGRTTEADPIVDERSFVAGNATSGYQVTSDLGEMGGTKLTIDGENSEGNNLGINGGGYKGITVNSGQTLEINNVGSVNLDESNYSYTIDTSMTNFTAIDILDGEGTVAYIKEGAQLNVENSVFADIKTETKWGGVFRIQASENDTIVNTIKNSYFLNNQAQNGAVIDVEGNVDIENCYFIDNIGTASNNALSVSQRNPGVINIKNSKFVHNINSSTTDKNNAAIYANGNSSNTINIEDSYIANNYGGIYIFNNLGASVIGTIKNTVFEGNESYDLYTSGAVTEISGSIFNSKVTFGSTVETIKKTDDTHRTVFNGIVDAKGIITTVSGADFNNTVTFNKAVTNVEDSTFGGSSGTYATTFKELVTNVEDSTFNGAVTFTKGATNIVDSEFNDTITANGAIGKIETSTFAKDATFGYSIGDIIGSTFNGTFTKTGSSQTINSINDSTFDGDVSFGKNYVTTIDNSTFNGNVEFNKDFDSPYESITNSTFNGTFLGRQGNEIINSNFNKGAIMFALKSSTNKFKVTDSSFKNGVLDSASNLLEIKGTLDIENTEISNNTGARNNYLIGAWQGDTNQKVLIHNGSKIDNNTGNGNYLIQNTGANANMTIMDSEIKGNSSNIAVLTNTNSSVLNLVANNDKQVLFQDNAVPAVENNSVTNMNADTSGKIIINDTLSGSGTININNSGLTYTSLVKNADDGTYNEVNNQITQQGGEYQFNNIISGQNINLYNGAKVKLSSYTKDTTTTYGVLNLDGKTFTNDANGGLLDAINDHFDEQNLGSTTLNSDLNFNLDVNLSTTQRDTATASYSGGSGKVILSDINVIGSKIWSDYTQSDIGTKIKILNSDSDSLQLGISSALEEEFNNAKILFNTTQVSSTDEAILNLTKWDKIYQTTIVEDNVYGKWGLATTSTENDSIGFNDFTIRETRYENMGDTLYLVNKDTTNAVKDFTANADGETYNLGKDLTATQGTLNINGIAGNGVETLNLNGKTGFQLGNGAVALNFNDVTVGGNTVIATVSNKNAQIGLNNTILNGNINSILNTGESYNLSLSGTTTVNGAVNSANATLSGTESVLKFNTNTFANAELNAQAGTINVQDGAYNNYEIGKLTSNDTVRYAIDMNLSKNNQDTDSFTVGDGSSGIIYLTLSSVNVTEDMDSDESAIIQVIKADSSGPELRYDGSYILNQAQAEMSTDYVLAKEFGLYTKDTTNDSIMVRGAQNVFRAWANLQTDEHKQFTFESNINDYEIADDITLEGNNNAEIINNGTVINNGTLKDFTLTNNNVFTNNSTDLSVFGGSNSGTIDGTGNLTNTGTFTNTGTISNSVSNSGIFTSKAENLGGTINNTGTLNLSGVLAKEISGTGTTVVNSALTLNDGSKIDGTLNLNNGNIVISEDSITQTDIGALKGTGNFALDIDYTGSAITYDTINILNDSTDAATIKITSLTENGTRPEDFTAQILIGANPDTKLDISEIKDLFDSTFDVNKVVSINLTTPTINWNADYGAEKWTEMYKSELTVTGSEENLSDTLKYETVKTGETEHIFDSKADNLAIINQYDGVGKDDREFNFDSKDNVFLVTENTGITESGTLTINGKSEGDERSIIDYNSHSGFELDNDNTTLILKDTEIKNSSSLVSGNAVNTNVILDNVNIHDNGSGIQTAGNIEIKGNSTISDDIQVTGYNSQVNIDGTDEVTLNNNLTGRETAALNISNGTVNISKDASISSLKTTLNNTSLNIANENSLYGLNTTFNGTNNLNIANDNIGTLAFGTVNLNGVLKMQVDADLANAQMDKLTAASATIGAQGRIEVSKINLMSPTTAKRLDLLFTDNFDLAKIVNYTGEGQIAYSPIYKYKTSYSQRSDGKGYFSFVTSGNSYSDFNPSIMASSVTAIVTGYQNQMQSLHDGFYHMDRYMKHSYSYRFAAENQNKYAFLSPSFNVNQVPETAQAMWVLPYTAFERVNLKGGVKVDNIAYGMTYGGDSNMFDMGYGFKGLISAFVGYNGNHMNYDGISMSQNGGFLGATLNAYKGNFFTGLTVSTGASTGDADTMYGHDNITLLTAGIANKTGYNFEFKSGKIILQPSLFLGYSWVNTFDYTNSAGVRINQDALNVLQIVPSLKIIGNTENGWQPYAGIDMVWNVFMGSNQVTANDVVLPQLSERAFVQYGIGIQRTWADRFTGFLQTMVRNGGRNGVVLSAGLRWTFGEDKKAENIEAKRKTIIKAYHHKNF